MSKSAARTAKTAGFKAKKRFRWKKALPVYLMVLPGVIYFLINNYLPMAGITIAFRKINYRDGIFNSPFCGFENFEFLFQSGNIQVAIRNTLLYNVAFIIIGTVFPIAVAILFNEIRGKISQKIYQTAILLPYLMSMVVVSYLVFAFISADTGFLNKSIIEPLTGKSIVFDQEKIYWPVILGVVSQWKGIGFSMILYFSTIIGISPDYYEAAKVDGASKWQQIRYITLPMLKPTVITMFILSVSKIFYSDFGLFYQVPRNSGTLYEVTQTVDTFVYNALMNQNNIAMSSAASVLQAIIGFILVVAANAVIRKTSEENALF